MGTEPRFRLTFWKVVFFLIMAVGGYAMFVRVFQGLGASTGLSDEFPWGLWIGFDVMTGVALAAGGFTIAATVYALHLEEFLPVLFYLSAIAVGLAMTIFESYLSNRAYGVSLHGHLLQKLNKALAVVLAVYLVARMGTLTLAGNLHLILAGSTESLAFALELVMGVIVPMAMLSSRKLCEHRAGLFHAAFLVVIGLILNRMNVGITGMQRHAAVTYVPSFLEAATSLAFVAGGLAVFGFVVRNFPVFSAPGADGREAPTAWDSLPAAARVPRHGMLSSRKGAMVFAGLGLVFAVALIAIALLPENHAMAVPPAQTIALSRREIPPPPIGDLQLPDDQVIRTSDRAPALVVFSHARHVGRNLQPCTNCHPKPFGMVRMQPGAQECASATMAACASCHDGSSTFEVGSACRICHPVDAVRRHALSGRDSCPSCQAHWKPGSTTPRCPGGAPALRRTCSARAPFPPPGGPGQPCTVQTAMA